MSITSMTIRGLIDDEGETRIANVSAETLSYYLDALSLEAIAIMSEAEFFDAALEYLEIYTDIVDTDYAKIDTIYTTPIEESV